MTSLTITGTLGVQSLQFPRYKFGLPDLTPVLDLRRSNPAADNPNSIVLEIQNVSAGKKEGEGR
jgi:hypothetical protein